MAPPTSRDNRTRLLTATLQYVACHGFHATTHAIAQWAQLGSGTLFRHLSTKQALLHAAFAHARTLLGRATLLEPPPPPFTRSCGPSGNKPPSALPPPPWPFTIGVCSAPRRSTRAGTRRRSHPWTCFAPCSTRCGRYGDAPTLATVMPG